MKKIVIILFLIIVIFAAYTEEIITVFTEGMDCKLCELAIVKLFRKIEIVNEVNVSYKTGKITIITNKFLDDKIIIETINKAGNYKIIKIKRDEINIIIKD